MLHEPRLQQPDWALEIRGDRFAENRHHGPDVLVADGPCAGQRVKLPVVYAKVFFVALQRALPLKIYYPYQYNSETQTYDFRFDVPSLPTNPEFWGY